MDRLGRPGHGHEYHEAVVLSCSIVIIARIAVFFPPTSSLVLLLFLLILKFGRDAFRSFFFQGRTRVNVCFFVSVSAKGVYRQAGVEGRGVANVTRKVC